VVALAVLLLHHQLAGGERRNRVVVVVVVVTMVFVSDQAVGPNNEEERRNLPIRRISIVIVEEEVMAFASAPSTKTTTHTLPNQRTNKQTTNKKKKIYIHCFCISPQTGNTKQHAPLRILLFLSLFQRLVVVVVVVAAAVRFERAHRNVGTQHTPVSSVCLVLGMIHSVVLSFQEVYGCQLLAPCFSLCLICLDFIEPLISSGPRVKYM